MNLKTIKRAINELKKDIGYYLDIGKVSLDDVPMMRYPDGVEPTRSKPCIQHGSKGGVRILFDRREKPL